MELRKILWEVWNTLIGTVHAHTDPLLLTIYKERETCLVTLKNSPKIIKGICHASMLPEYKKEICHPKIFWTKYVMHTCDLSILKMATIELKFLVRLKL